MTKPTTADSDPVRVSNLIHHGVTENTESVRQLKLRVLRDSVVQNLPTDNDQTNDG